MVSGSGISWAICKSAPHSRQITTPAPHHSVFTGRMPFLPPNQQRQSTEGSAVVKFRENEDIICMVGCVRAVLDATFVHSDMHTHMRGFVSLRLQATEGCGQIATICGALFTVLRLIASVCKPTDPHPIAFSAFTLLVGHQDVPLTWKNWVMTRQRVEIVISVWKVEMMCT